MEDEGLNPAPESKTPRLFPPTHWSVVLEAGRGSSDVAREAFGRLYQAYQGPLLAFLRRDGCSEDQARDQAQGFFEFLLERQGLSTLEQTGRFRNWLLTCLRRYLGDRRDKDTALKRGGGKALVPIGTDEEEGPMVDPPSPGRTPEQEFHRQFALRFVDQVLQRLREEYVQLGKVALFDRLRPLLLDKKDEVSQGQIARELGVAVGTVHQEVSRLRSRFRRRFDQELTRLVDDRELEDEKRFLLNALRA